VEWVILGNKIMFLQLRDLNSMSQLVPIDGSPETQLGRRIT
jgi:hypothetical protein